MSSTPNEEELRAAYEAELSRLSASDVIAQAAVSLLNIGAYRLMPPAAAEQTQDPASPAQAGQPGAEPAGERDLEQARDAIDAVRALLEILERRIPQEVAPLRDALSRLQMTYARTVGSASTDAGPPQPEQAPSTGAQPPGQVAERDSASKGPGPAESSGRLWVPGR